MAWPIIAFMLFLVLPQRRAVVASFVFAWLFLPVAEIEISGLTDISKMTITCLTVLAATMVFDSGRVMSFRPAWYDIFPIILILGRIPTSITNGLGIYDGISGAQYAFLTWGLPYFLGRIYFNDLESMRELAIAIVIGGLVYTPLVLWEWRMSPQLHETIYGTFQHNWLMMKRGDGWRPIVFMKHGLMVGLWMATAALAAFWLWFSGSQKTLLGLIPMAPLAFGFLVVTVLVKSWGAVALMAMGVSVMLATYYTRNKWALVALLLIPIVYVAPRAAGIWDGYNLLPAAETVFGPDRAESLETRIRSDWVLADRARERVLFGWGAYGRNTDVGPRSKVGKIIPDSLWVITFGKYGLAGLIPMACMMLLPAFLLARRIPPNLWTHPKVAPTFALAVCVAVWMIDNTLNAMLNPIYVLIAGGLISLPKVVVRKRQPAAEDTETERRRSYVSTPA
jgi:hypothetical protein